MALSRALSSHHFSDMHPGKWRLFASFPRYIAQPQRTRAYAPEEAQVQIPRHATTKEGARYVRRFRERYRRGLVRLSFSSP
jgi:hypothetical protein